MGHWCCQYAHPEDIVYWLDGKIDPVVSSIQAHMGKLNEVSEREMRDGPDPWQTWSERVTPPLAAHNNRSSVNDVAAQSWQKLGMMCTTSLFFTSSYFTVNAPCESGSFSSIKYSNSSSEKSKSSMVLLMAGAVESYGDWGVVDRVWMVDLTLSTMPRARLRDEWNASIVSTPSGHLQEADGSRRVVYRRVPFFLNELFHKKSP